MSDVQELDDVAARALTSIILERTADAVNEGGTGAEAALRALADETGMVLDVCAGILQATSWLAGTGGIEPSAIFAASVAFQPENDEAPPIAPSEAPESTDSVDQAPDAEPGPEAVTEPSSGQSEETAESEPVEDEVDFDDFVRKANEAAARAIATVNGENGGTDDTP